MVDVLPKKEGKYHYRIYNLNLGKEFCVGALSVDMLNCKETSVSPLEDQTQGKISCWCFQE